MSENMVVIVTGASRGIGLASAHWLLKHGHNVVVLARSKEPLEALRQQFPNQVEVLVGDVTDFTLGTKAHELAVKTWKRLDGLILNHGVIDPIDPIAKASAEAWRKCFDINVFSYVAAIQACLVSLRQSKGRIIMCSSGASQNAIIDQGAYGSTKAVLNRLAVQLKAEEPDVTTISLRPGMVDTEMQRGLREDYIGKSEHTSKYFGDAHKDGRLLRPDQPGNVMAQLAVAAPHELSGQYISWNDAALDQFQGK